MCQYPHQRSALASRVRGNLLMLLWSRASDCLELLPPLESRGERLCLGQSRAWHPVRPRHPRRRSRGRYAFGLKCVRKGAFRELTCAHHDCVDLDQCRVFARLAKVTRAGRHRRCVRSSRRRQNSRLSSSAPRGESSLWFCPDLCRAFAPCVAAT